MTALHLPSKSQASKAIQWWSNVSSVLLERLNCGAVNSAFVVNEEICEELQEPFSSCYDATAMAAATDDNSTVWSSSRVNTSRTRSIRNRLNRFRSTSSTSRGPLVNSDSSSPSSSEILHPPSCGGSNSNRSTPTRSSRRTRRSGDEDRRHSVTPSSHEQQLQHQFPAATDASFCDTSTTASMNTRHTFEDSLDEDDDEHYVGFDVSSSHDLVKRHRHFYHPYVPPVSNNNNYCEQTNRRTSSPKSQSSPAPIFRESVITPPRKLRSRTAGITSPTRETPTVRESHYSAVPSPDRSTIPTNRGHNARKKDVSNTTHEKPHPSLIRLGPSHYINAQPTSSITSISVRLSHQRKLWNGNVDVDDDDSSIGDDSCSTLSSLSSGEHEIHHQLVKKQNQTATNLRRLLMERKPLCVNQ